MDRLWQDYEQHHRSGGNQYCHMLGIPLIIIGLLGLLAIPLFRIGPWRVEVALVLVLVVGAVDVWLDPRLGSAMLAVSLLLYLGARAIGWKIALALFVAGWIFQFIGHGVYEKHRPAFYQNLAHLLVGPLWVLNHFVRLRSSRESAPLQGDDLRQ